MSSPTSAYMDRSPTPSTRAMPADLPSTSPSPSDAGDPTYESGTATPKKRKAGHAAPTPNKRRVAASSVETTRKRAVDAEVKRRDRSSTKNYRTRCVVSRATDKMTLLEYAHVLPAATRSAELDQLEWCWGMSYRTLNVDSRRNIHPLRSSMHKWFDITNDKKAVGWFWLPTDIRLLAEMHEFYVTMQNVESSEPGCRRDIDSVSTVVSTIDLDSCLSPFIVLCTGSDLSISARRFS
ncbi:hypothetical protein BD626DRAFT_509601 [Schizophyllum amplum]|uniref:HNH nuclease domain-containing protein n=1 Tax=Schizophyllum amplum TaxID=97359 RepID=A0A550C2M1_9AGAR|nr:hypothetical protein BD626DRAFT_509601 [Auriculariopsis ampla]